MEVRLNFTEALEYFASDTDMLEEIQNLPNKEMLVVKIKLNQRLGQALHFFNIVALLHETRDSEGFFQIGNASNGSNYAACCERLIEMVRK